MTKVALGPHTAAMMVVASKSGEVGRDWPAHGVQLAYNDTRLEEEYPKGNA